jgi:hypothetical protein
VILRKTVNGKPATVAYLTLGPKGEFNLVKPEKATLVKVMFDDGGLIFGSSLPLAQRPPVSATDITDPGHQNRDGGHKEIPNE